MPNTLQTNAQQPQTDPKKKGTGFTNLQSILGANNGSNLGQNLVKNVNQNVGGTVGNIQGANNQFTQQTAQEQQRLGGLQQGSQNALNQIINAPGTAKADDKLINDQDVKNYTGYVGANYQGPSNLNNADNLKNQQTNSQQYANALGSQGGQQQLLRTFVNQPNYTNAQQNLDSLILGGQPIQNNLKQARSQALKQLAQNNVGALSNSAQQKAMLNQQGLLQGKQQIQDQTQNVVGGINTDISNQLKGLQDATNTANSQYGQLAQNNFDAKDANGNPILSPTQRNILNAYLKNNIANPQSLINYQGPTDLTNAGVANQTQAAQLSALSQITGNSGLALTPGQGQKIGDASAGQLNISNIVEDARNRSNPYLNNKTIADIAKELAPGFRAATNDLSGSNGGNISMNAGNLDPETATAFNDILRQNLGGEFSSYNKGGEQTLSGLQNQFSGGTFNPQIAAIQKYINQYYGLGAGGEAPLVNKNTGGSVNTVGTNTPVVKR